MVCAAVFDRFPLDSIQLPKHLDQDVADLPEAAKKLTKNRWHEWIVANKQWKKAVQGYLASLSFADDMIGELLTALDDGPLADNTTVILWGDHGYHLGEKQHWEKFALWENTTRVPLIVVAPEQTKPNTRCENPVSLLDLYPTLVELCGLKSPQQKLEGQSRRPAQRLQTQSSNGWLLLRKAKTITQCVPIGHRYIQYADGSEELYDHDKDPHEWTNLASDDRYAATKKLLAGFLPKINAEPFLPPEKSKTN